MSVPDSSPAIAAIIARLSLIPDHDVFDGGPDSKPPQRYLCVYDQTGVAVRGKYTGRAGWLYLPIQVSVVTRTLDGLRKSTKAVRDALLDWPPTPGATPLVEDGSNPVLTEGEGNDVRLTAPITLHCYLPPKEG